MRKLKPVRERGGSLHPESPTGRVHLIRHPHSPSAPIGIGCSARIEVGDVRADLRGVVPAGGLGQQFRFPGSRLGRDTLLLRERRSSGGFLCV